MNLDKDTEAGSITGAKYGREINLVRCGANKDIKNTILSQMKRESVFTAHHRSLP